MATVYLARQESMGRYVAVKVIHQAFAGDPSATERFQREAKIIAQLEHLHILPVYDFDSTHIPPYIVMRYMQAGTLKDIMQRTKLPLEDIAHIYTQIGSAVDYAHKQGVIHRDIKPANILVDIDGNAFLTDFGIAFLTEMGGSLTGTGSTVGTPGYMAPEQATSHQVTGQADVYSLGVVLFELLTGQPPFIGETPMSVLLKHINDTVPSVRTVDPTVDGKLDAILQKAMAKDPSERYQTAGDLANALRDQLTLPLSKPMRLVEVVRESVTTQNLPASDKLTPRSTAAEVPGSIAAVSLDETTVQTMQQQISRYKFLSIALTLLVIVGGLLLFLLLRERDEERVSNIEASSTAFYTTQTARAPTITPTLTASVTSSPTNTYTPTPTPIATDTPHQHPDGYPDRHRHPSDGYGACGRGQGIHLC
jgi:serine/threonine protein kinase